MQKDVYRTKKTNKNKDFLGIIKSGLIDLENKIGKMPRNEIKIEKPNETADIVDILEFNNQNQERQRLKTLTTDQML